jgi:hypothetical protein
MKFFTLFGVALLGALPVCAQKALPPPPAQNGSGAVIFSRSTDAEGRTSTEAAAPPVAKPAAAPLAIDAERAALSFTDYDMDVRLRTAEQKLAVRALIVVRNDGKTPLTRLPLQLSSSLNWESIRVQGREVSFQSAIVNSDADHTGQLHEAAVALPAPLAAGASLQLDVTYSGAIVQTAQRLLAVGTPEAVALHSDWDRISTDFTGLRGFGNVVWYPVASVPVILGDGARLFDEMGEHKRRIAGAQFRLRLTVEFPHGQAPNLALVNGHPVELAVHDSPVTSEYDGVATAATERAPLGFEAPSLFVAYRTAQAATDATLWTQPVDVPAVPSWTASTARVVPFLQGWLGQKPRAQLTVLDLPDAEDAPFETGALLATSIRIAPNDQLDGILSHALTHAWMQSPRAWLSEGVAHFMGTLWLERTRGRKLALESLENTRPALAMVEPSSPGVSVGQPLAEAVSPIYYRTKATYVFWMLRDVVGDEALSAALRAYNPAEDARAGSGPSVFQKLLEQAGVRRDLSWFFSDWVNADKGLPDLAVDGVFPSSTNAGNWLVAVNLSNNGYAACEVPVTVRSDKTSVTQRMLVPAHGKAVQRILIQGRPIEVQTGDGTVPETGASVHLSKMSDTLVGTPVQVSPPVDVPPTPQQQ